MKTGMLWWMLFQQFQNGYGFLFLLQSRLTVSLCLKHTPINKLLIIIAIDFLFFVYFPVRFWQHQTLLIIQVVWILFMMDPSQRNRNRNTVTGTYNKAMMSLHARKKPPLTPPKRRIAVHWEIKPDTELVWGVIQKYILYKPKGMPQTIHIKT